MLIEIVPTRIGVSLADSVAYKKAPAGAPANVAIGVSRLGGSVAFIGKVRVCFCNILLVVILHQIYNFLINNWHCMLNGIYFLTS